METDIIFNVPDCNAYSRQGDSMTLIAVEAVLCR